MVLVVSDIETKELVVLAILTLDKGEDQATVLIVGVLHLQRSGASELQPRVSYTQTIGNGERNLVALLQLGGVEVASTQIDAHHVVETILIL